ncbi:hypothetical protein L249_6868 [Ophiocordyceps polyrhachis-furcata BCC 54312]|uniref:TauD/TfdA-like domain-containing protein n=1 Tax=Ophiocordyceps polyrhachis-furcata BCC 54312 TaxID=1330021 RepID=A0A367LK04_9HYPO|nr:hypothetical protein L249_6868 [Ophiocordyceps polyrhachis-furcata BCC 54312]
MAGCVDCPVMGPHVAVTFPGGGLQKASSPLPHGFPAVLNSPPGVGGEELETALAGFKELGLDAPHISRHNFRLPTLGPRLKALGREVYDGRGFGLVRGLDRSKYLTVDLTMLFLGIQSYVADRQGCQDSKGNVLVHIYADDSTQAKATHHRHSTAEIKFHNEEAGDIVGWLTRSTADRGGKCIIASTHTVYNVMAASRPDLVRALARSDWPFALPQFQCRPVIFYHDGRLITSFGRAALQGSASHPRPDRLPGLTRLQIEALDMVEETAKATQLEMATQPGDIHFINNLALLHRREAFVDGQSQRRHLVRTILRDESLGWDIPRDLRREWYRAFEAEKPRREWHPDIMPNGFFPLRSHPN